MQRMKYWIYDSGFAHSGYEKISWRQKKNDSLRFCELLAHSFGEKMSLSNWVPPRRIIANAFSLWTHQTLDPPDATTIIRCEAGAQNFE